MKQVPSMPRLLNYHEASSLCGVKPISMYSIRAGRVHIEGIGVRWREDVLRAWFAARCPRDVEAFETLFLAAEREALGITAEHLDLAAAGE